MKIEFFSADCRLCERTLDIINNRFPDIDMYVHRASECIDGTCCDLASRYCIRAIPSLVINGKLFFSGVPSEQDINALQNMLFG